MNVRAGTVLDDEIVESLDLYRVVSEQTTTYRLDEGGARDAMLAYAMRGEVAEMTEVTVPSHLVSVDWDLSLNVGRRDQLLYDAA